MEVTKDHDKDQVVKSLISFIDKNRWNLGKERKLEGFKIGKAVVEKSNRYHAFDKTNSYTWDTIRRFSRHKSFTKKPGQDVPDSMIVLTSAIYN